MNKLRYSGDGGETRNMQHKTERESNEYKQWETVKEKPGEVKMRKMQKLCEKMHKTTRKIEWKFKKKIAHFQPKFRVFWLKNSKNRAENGKGRGLTMFRYDTWIIDEKMKELMIGHCWNTARTEECRREDCCEILDGHLVFWTVISHLKLKFSAKNGSKIGVFGSKIGFSSKFLSKKGFSTWKRDFWDQKCVWENFELKT